jgi:hypothetical protein
MAQVCVVTRQIAGMRPVPSIVISASTAEDIDHMESWFKSQANSHIQDIKEQYPEFEDAVFYTDILQLS